MKKENIESIVRHGVRWKGNAASLTAFHKWLDKHYGQPKTCENPNCWGKSKIYDWALIKGEKLFS